MSAGSADLSTTTYLHRRGAGQPSIVRRPRRPGSPCSHCDGSGREPATLDDRAIRSERGMLARIARSSGIDKSAISRMFAGQSVPSLATIVLASDAIGISEGRLIHCPPVWHRLLQEIAADED